MLTQLLGFTLTRTIPPSVLLGVLSGAFKVYGGVVRNGNGEIVAHLINAIDPLSMANPIDIGFRAINSYQLLRIGQHVGDVKQVVDGITQSVQHLTTVTENLVGLATGTMLLSGLTLGVSAAGFAFLDKKLNRIDDKLQQLQKDVKEVKDFLHARQRAELATALNTLRDVGDSPTDETRRQLLIHSRQTLGTLHHHYRSQFTGAARVEVMAAAEEYFAITAIAHALAAGELDMYETAASDLDTSVNVWCRTCRKFAIDKLLRDPERFLSRRFAGILRVDELIDWLEFANEDEKGLTWVDELRGRRIVDPWYPSSLSQSERIELDLLRKFVSRNRILESYRAQYQFLKRQKTRPSSFEQQVSKFDSSQMVQGAYILIPDELANSN